MRFAILGIFLAAGLGVGGAFFWLGLNLGGWLLLGSAALYSLAIEVTRDDRRCCYLGSSLFGVMLTVTGCYWLPETITRFGGFSQQVAWVLFILYALASSLQFVCVAVISRWFNRSAVANVGLALPVAWMICELFFPRLFPWALAHPLLPFSSFSALAEIVGTAPLGALVLFWCGMLGWLVRRVMFTGRWRTDWSGQQTRFVVVMATFTLGVLWWGYQRSNEVIAHMAGAPPVTVGLIQGNLSTSQKGDVTMLEANIDTYRERSREALNKGAQLLLWPESVANFWLPEELGRLPYRGFHPFPESNTPLLFGGLSFRVLNQSELRQNGSITDSTGGVIKQELAYFNTAFGVGADSEILGRYHKQVLMPFGEYMPLASRFPALKKLSPHTADFSFGDLKRPINFLLEGSNGAQRSLLVSPLICYEDLVARLGREASASGGEVLVNLTNDAWYGDTRAPYQHNELAAWRAVETRRYLLRVTNTGFTTVINPLGKTEAALPLFSAGALVRDIVPMTEITSYVVHGETVSYLILVVAVTLRFFSRRQRTLSSQQVTVRS